MFNLLKAKQRSENSVYKKSEIFINAGNQEPISELYEILENNSPFGIIKSDLNGEIIYANKFICELLELNSFNELYSKSVLDIYQIKEERIKLISLLSKTGEVRNFNTNFITAKGNVKHILLSAHLNSEAIIEIIQDITHLKQSHQKTEESYSLLQSTLNSTADGILVVDMTGKIVYYNQNFLKMWQIPLSLAQSGDDNGLISFVLDQLKNPEEFVTKVRELYSYPEQESKDILEFKDGRTFDRFSRPFINKTKIVGRVWSFRNITEIRIAENDLKESNYKYKTLFETANDAIFLIKSNKFVDCNPKAEILFGCTREKIIDETPFKFSPPLQPDGRSSRDKALELIQKAFNNENLYFEWKHCKLDGTLLDTEVNLNCVKISGDSMLQAIVRDVTHQNRAKLQKEAVYKISLANNSETDLNQFFKETHNIIKCFIPADNFYIALYDEENNIISYPYWVDEFDPMPEPGAPGKGLTEYILRSGTPLLADPVTFKDLVNRREVEIILTDSIDWLGVPLKVNNKIIGALAVQSYSNLIRYGKEDLDFLTFVSTQIAIAIQRKKFIEELIIEKDKAEEVNRLKSNFLANMSHELRTPMVAILGYADILRRELHGSEMKQMSAEIFESGERLLGTLNSILDLSKIESNKMELNSREIDVGEITENQVRSLLALAYKKNLDLNVFINDKNKFAKVDEGLFRQILNNLVGNAIKFTNKGSVEIIVDTENFENLEWISVSVKDTGIGIAENKKHLIFDEFRQASEGMTRGFEGNGLGLTITRKFVDLMNGRIFVESKLGQGSTFKVCFPSIEAPEHATDAPIDELNPIESTNKSRVLKDVLLVEDVTSNSDVIRILLRDICNVDIVESGEEAIQIVKKKNYSAILMDIDLGIGMSGIETSKQIRKLSHYESIPIIAVTALAMKGHKEQFLAEGCSHYISKPFQSKEIREIVAGILNEQESRNQD